jgi:hypothetical protein
VVSAALGALAALSRDAAARDAITADADWRAPWREGTLPAITAVMRWQIETAAAQVGGAPSGFLNDALCPPLTRHGASIMLHNRAPLTRRRWAGRRLSWVVR